MTESMDIVDLFEADEKYGPTKFIGAKTDRADAKAAIEDATAQREKEAKAFAAEATEDKANLYDGMNVWFITPN